MKSQQLIIDDIAEHFNQAFENFGEAYQAMEDSITKEMSSNHKWQDGLKSLADLYPPITYRSGPAPHKRGYCGFCATATHKQQTKLDSCPQCGVSYMKYGRK